MVWFIGFVWFLGFKPTATKLEDHRKIDGIVALTGGVGRIEAGIDALNMGIGKRLLISGVNASLNTTTILNAYDSTLEHCKTKDDTKCISLGRQALDTMGNALETKIWVQENNLKTLMVITSDYHMRRALLELEQTTPETEIYPFIIETKLKWSSIALEYTKYLYSLAKHSIFT
jgi:uncharacterized SAM-binding protein YcdF (DUF218 family)